MRHRTYGGVRGRSREAPPTRSKLIVFKDSSEKDRSEQNQLGEDREERVFSVFKKATKVAAESFASKDLLEQFEQ
jgi:hypothetical protein